MTHAPRRPVSTLAKVIAVAIDLGVDRAKLERLRGPEPWLELAIPERIRRAEAVWSAILAALPDRAFPLDYAAAIDPDDFGVLGLAVRCAPDLRRACDRILRYASLFTPSPPWAWREPPAPELVALELRPRLSADARLHEVLAATWVAEFVALVRRMTEVELNPEAVLLPGRPPGEASRYAAFFGVEAQQDAAWTGLILRAEALELPLVRADAGVSAFLLEQLDALAAAETQRKRPSLDQRIRPMITAALADGGPPKLPDIARQLGMSPRTLRRRLDDAERSWSELVEETRRELAFSLLRAGELELAEVSFMLGYSEPSAFFRAFRRWTGQTPSEWRS